MSIKQIIAEIAWKADGICHRIIEWAEMRDYEIAASEIIKEMNHGRE